MITSKEKNQRILDLTLEIIFLLTGEDQVLLKAPGESIEGSSGHQAYKRYCRTRRARMKPSLIHERHNEQKILELSNQIIRLLTGEVPIRCEDVAVYRSMEEWVYVEIQKDVMMEHEHPVLKTDASPASVSVPDLETRDETEITADRGEKRLKNENSGRAKAATNPSSTFLSPENGNLLDIDIYPPPKHPHKEYPPPDIKEELILCEERDVPGRAIHKLPEHSQKEYPSPAIKEDSALCEERDVPGRAVHRLPEHSQKEYPPPAIKEDSALCEERDVPGRVVYKFPEHSQKKYPPPAIKEDSALCEERDVPGRVVYKFPEHSQKKYPPPAIKEDSALCEERDVPGRVVYKFPEHSQKKYPPPAIKEDSALCEERDVPVCAVYIYPEHPQEEYLSMDMKEETGSCEEGNLTGSDLYEPPEHTLMEYSSTDIKETTLCEERNLTENDAHKASEYLQIVYPSTDIKEEPASCEEMKQTVLYINLQKIPQWDIQLLLLRGIGHM
uniref:Uncharacterized protein n=1 Tax=Leptobrachium leishanense TaxID=445787 RepID=A0A8C5PHA1_9ANUR